MTSSDPGRDPRRPAAVPGLLPGGSAGSAVGSVQGSFDPPRGHVRPGARAAAVVVTVLCAVVLGVLYVVFVTTATGQALDHAAFRGAMRGQGELWRIASPVLDVVSEGFVVVGLALAVVVAIARRRWSLAFQAVVVIAGANLSTQLLKHVLARSELGIGRAANSFPSGHTTVAASVVVALVIAAPRRWRPGIAVAGAVYAAGTGISVLVGQWHRVSDAVAALVVVALWTAVATLFVTRGSLDDVGTRRDRPYALRFLWGVGLVSATVAAVGGRNLAVRLDLATVTSDDLLLAYVLGMVAVIAASCLALAVVLQLRQLVTLPREAVHVPPPGAQAPGAPPQPTPPQPGRSSPPSPPAYR